jgi:hypothetical protein
MPAKPAARLGVYGASQFRMQQEFCCLPARQGIAGDVDQLPRNE